jgi:hypothetical protein
MWHAPVKPTIVAGLLILLPWALHVLKQRWGAPARYYGLVLVSPLLVLGLWKAPVTFLDKAPLVGFALVIAVCLLPPLLLGYSLQALLPPTRIPYWASIPGLVVSSICTLSILMALFMSQAGYIVG